MIKRVVLLSLLASAVAFAGCGNSDDDDNVGGTGGGSAPTGCTVDTTLGCAGAAVGYSCAINDNPETEDASLSCSDPNTDSSSEDTYCCVTGFTGSASTCQSSDDITGACPDPTSIGFTCAPGDDPTTLDATLNCSASTADGDSDDFCCNSTGTTVSGGGGGGGDVAPSGCTADSTLDCSGSGAIGYSCAIDSNPEDEDSSLTCSVPAQASGEDDYCCFTGFTGTDSTCAANDTLDDACPDPNSYAFTCAAGDNPNTLDPSLNCSDSTADGDSDDFCCTY